jgi:hypothetical protein
MARKKKNKALELVEETALVNEEVSQVEATEEVAAVEEVVAEETTEEAPAEEVLEVQESEAPVEEVKEVVVTIEETTEETAIDGDPVEALAVKIKHILKTNLPRTYVPKNNEAAYAKLILTGGTVAVLKNGRLAHVPNLAPNAGGRRELMRKHPVKYILNDLI